MTIEVYYDPHGTIMGKPGIYRARLLERPGTGVLENIATVAGIIALYPFL